MTKRSDAETLAERQYQKAKQNFLAMLSVRAMGVTLNPRIAVLKATMVLKEAILRGEAQFPVDPEDPDDYIRLRAPLLRALLDEIGRHQTPAQPAFPDLHTAAKNLLACAR